MTALLAASKARLVAAARSVGFWTLLAPMALAIGAVAHVWFAVTEWLAKQRRGGQ